jgi:predicted NBD/HSP70 family sugar kinase
MSPAKPSLELLRSLTDEHVLRALLEAPRLTRAELAARTGLSKPTVSESVRRLTGAGLLRDTGERTTGRGRVGSYYALADGLGCVLVTSIAPEGVVAEVVDVQGRVVAREVAPLPRPAGTEVVAQALRTSSARALSAARGPLRGAVVSAADPVERATGRLVHLPDAPFLVGELAPAEVLAPLVGDVPVHVDNDVNWAARAERAAAGDLDDFAYLHLGEGLGCAVVAGGEVVLGRNGLAGEVAHIMTRGPGGGGVRFIEVFGELGLRQPGSSAVDVDRLAAAEPPVLAGVARAVADVVAALVALADPEVVVVGGSWGPAALPAIAAEAAGLPRPAPVRAAAVTHEAPLAGARSRALADLRAAVLAGSVPG